MFRNSSCDFSKDWKYLSLSHLQKQRSTSLVGKFAVRDFGTPKQLMEFFDANISLLSVKFQTVQLEYTAPLPEKKNSRMHITLVDHSEGILTA